MEPVKVKIINKSNNPTPSYSTVDSAGMDVRAFVSEPITLAPLERVLVPTGLYMELPCGYQCEIRPRSGLALKKGITVLNTPGTIDADYRGEVGIILINLSNEPFVINNGERICQMVIMPYSKAELVEVKELNDTERGEGGFGHTGIK
ncbi:MAG: dUTP diphosphatase [Bacteroidales bacterium]|nr:dUTP diphosphatase [Bacteroidales bacterium]